MKKTGLKLWQILTLAGTGLVTLCLVCVAGGLVVSTLVPAAEPTAAVLNVQAPVKALALAPTAMTQSSPIPPSQTPIPPATATTAPTNTAIPSLTPAPAQASAPQAPACVPPNPIEAGTVVDVIDGDTIDVFVNGQVQRVRYIGVDTPETKHPDKPVQPYGPEASAKNTELVGGQQVVMVRDVSETDRYGRLLRYVFVGSLGGTFVNYELVRLGYAQASTYPPDVACSDYFLQAQQTASQAAIGLWGLPPAAPTLAPSLTPYVSGAGGSGGGVAAGSCNCSGPDLDCKDFSTHAAAQSCYDFCRSNGYGDVFRLDGSDQDGRACESLP